MKIQFLNRWKQYAPGDTNITLDYGTMDALVRRGTASWLEKPVEVSPAKAMDFPPADKSMSDRYVPRKGGRTARVGV